MHKIEVDDITQSDGFVNALLRLGMVYGMTLVMDHGPEVNTTMRISDGFQSNTDRIQALHLSHVEAIQTSTLCYSSMERLS